MTHGYLTLALARARIDDLRRSASHRGGPRQPPPTAAAPDRGAVTLRFGFPDDAAALGHLAALDSSEPPAHPVLLAEVAGELRAALSLSDGAVIADPFHPTAALIDLLHARAGQLTGGGPRRGRLRSWFRLGQEVADG